MTKWIVKFSETNEKVMKSKKWTSKKSSQKNATLTIFKGLCKDKLNAVLRKINMKYFQSI